MSPDFEALGVKSKMMIPLVFSNKDIFGLLKDEESLFLFSQIKESKVVEFVDPSHSVTMTDDKLELKGGD